MFMLDGIPKLRWAWGYDDVPLYSSILLDDEEKLILKKEFRFVTVYNVQPYPETHHFPGEENE